LEPGITDTVLASRDFAGIHFTGSTHVFKDIWAKIETNIHHYKTYPRIVGETGGKDFIIAHSSANPKQVSTGLFVVLLSSKDKMFSSFTSLCTTKYVASCKSKLLLMLNQ
jgi:acyl-CoA reductase-like NAD-dependent aldehyde dehydrogenase